MKPLKSGNAEIEAAPMMQKVGVCDGAVQRHLGADADPHDHEAELVVQAVGEHTPEIILDHGVEDRKRRHQRTDRHQDLGAGEAARERVDRELRGERREEDRAGLRRLGIRILQPIV
jgi:IS5 family transposase